VALASLEDINVHLPQDKLVALDANETKEQLDAQRIIFAKLSNTFSAGTLAGWASPATTPQTIRAVAGRLIAALIYARAFSSEVDGVPEYSQGLYTEAMTMLDQIIDGTITLPEVTEEVETGGNLNASFFYPNDDATGPYFTMGARF
jgi:hypothetical protein